MVEQLTETAWWMSWIGCAEVDSLNYTVNCPNLGHTLIVCGTNWQGETQWKTKGCQSKLWGVDLLQLTWLGDLSLLEDKQHSAMQTGKNCMTVLIRDTWLKLDVASCVRRKDWNREILHVGGLKIAGRASSSEVLSVSFDMWHTNCSFFG